MTNKPLALMGNELKELAAHPGLQEMWGADNSAEMETILRHIYTVKFEFVSGGPGYVGDLFLIHGDVLDSTIPVVRFFRNRDNNLEILH
jgi:hypothetical protein